MGKLIAANRSVLICIVFITIAHAAIWINYYSGTALGESPALDNRQTLLLAEQMAAGTLNEEPFHRAPLYPWILSLFVSIGFGPELLPFFARVLNLFALATIALSTAIAALSIWKRTAAAWIAGLLVGLNPVLIFFSGDAFDILLATAALGISLALYIQWRESQKVALSIWIGITLAIGSALRSHLLPLALAWSVAAVLFSKERRPLNLTGAITPLALSLILLGIANLSVSGEFRMLPWQGSYNLWAGNGPQANGKIYAQQLRVQFDSGYDNPAKLESIALFEAETGQTPPHSISEMNAHWRTKTLSYIIENPANWIGLMFKKAYYFLNSYEQYDNKTYGFHKQLHRQLRWNPIHWGALLLLAVAGTLCGLRSKESRGIIIAAICIFAIYAAGSILFYTSNRFRIPMLPVLAILSGGILCMPSTWRTSSSLWRRTFATCLLATIGITYSGLFSARTTETWQEDRAMLANASMRSGRDADTLKWASEALQGDAQRIDMHAVRAQASFNIWALNENSITLSEGAVENLLREVRIGSEHDPLLEPITGIYLWKLGQEEKALEHWKNHVSRDALALVCLHYASQFDLPKIDALQNYRAHPTFNLLFTLIAKQDTQAIEDLDRTFTEILSPAIPDDEASNKAYDFDLTQ